MNDDRQRSEDDLNQCDGCRQGAPLRNGIHVAWDGYPIMACQRDRYPCPQYSDGLHRAQYPDGNCKCGAIL